MSQPLRLTIEHDDGSSKSIDFAKLDKTTRLTLAKLGLCPVPAAIGTSKHYVLLEWEGWTEVLGIEADSVDLLRYYVIRRIDDRGRLSFQAGSEDPQVFVIERLPKDLKAIVVANAGELKTYDLSPETERWEGIFEAGGKIEYVKYDKTAKDPAISKDAVPETKLSGAFRSALSSLGFEAKKLLATEETQRIDAYRQIAAAMGIYGKEKQEDVYGLIELLARQAV